MRIFASTGKIMSDELVITRDHSSENRAWSEKMERQADSKEFDHCFAKVGIRPEGAAPLTNTELLNVLLNLSQSTKN